MFLKLRASGKMLFAFAFSGCLVFSAGAKPHGLDARPSVGAFLNGTMPEMAPGISGNWSAVVAFTNLIFTNSVGLAPVPGTDELVRLGTRRPRLDVSEFSRCDAKKTRA